LRTERYTTPRSDFPEVQHHWSIPEGNVRAAWRETSLHRSLQKFIPVDADGRPLSCQGEARFYIAPGESMCRKSRRAFEQVRADLVKADGLLSRIELEFSSPASGPASLPKAYKTLTVDWALSVTEAVLVCIDGERGSAKGEAHEVLAPIQVVFRCREEDVSAWIEYLQPRLRGRRHLNVVHPHISVGRA
jgi:hypothetical protein